MVRSKMSNEFYNERSYHLAFFILWLDVDLHYDAHFYSRIHVHGPLDKSAEIYKPASLVNDGYQSTEQYCVMGFLVDCFGNWHVRLHS